MITGTAKSGQSAPYLLEDPTPKEIAIIDDIFTRFGARMPSGTIVFDVVAFNNARPL